MNRIFTRQIEVDFDGNYNVEVPEEICEELGLITGDIIVFEHLEDRIIIRKRMEY